MGNFISDVFGGLFGGLFGDDGFDMPVVQADNPSRQAESIVTKDQSGDRQKQLASLLLADWYNDKDTLGKKGMTGL